jgi:hypothetical protein
VVTEPRDTEGCARKGRVVGAQAADPQTTGGGPGSMENGQREDRR